jgi:hypothetical protein
VFNIQKNRKVMINIGLKKTNVDMPNTDVALEGVLRFGGLTIVAQTKIFERRVFCVE